MHRGRLKKAAGRVAIVVTMAVPALTMAASPAHALANNGPVHSTIADLLKKGYHCVPLKDQEGYLLCYGDAGPAFVCSTESGDCIQVEYRTTTTVRRPPIAVSTQG